MESSSLQRGTSPVANDTFPYRHPQGRLFPFLMPSSFYFHLYGGQRFNGPPTSLDDYWYFTYETTEEWLLSGSSNPPPDMMANFLAPEEFGSAGRYVYYSPTVSVFLCCSWAEVTPPFVARDPAHGYEPPPSMGAAVWPIDGVGIFAQPSDSEGIHIAGGITYPMMDAWIPYDIVYEYDYGKMNWEGYGWYNNVTATGDIPISTRMSFTWVDFTGSNSDLWLFGGLTHLTLSVQWATKTDQISKYTVATRTWTSIRAHTGVSRSYVDGSTHIGASACYSPVRVVSYVSGAVWFYGPIGSDRGPRGDIWSLDFGGGGGTGTFEWDWIRMNDGDEGYNYVAPDYDDDEMSNRWPGIRSAPGVITMEDSAEMYVFGGGKFDFLNHADLWVFRIPSYLCYGIPRLSVGFVCSGHGFCTSEDTCLCDPSPAYSGENCEIWYCNGTMRNESSDVCNLGNGTCLASETCNCTDPDQYDGIFCEFPVCGGLYGLEACHGGNGTCVAPSQCRCEDDTKYTGTSCDVPVCNLIPNTDPSVCSGNGTCVAYDHCLCDDDTKYIGLDCEVPVCNLIPNSDSSVCSGNGTCVAYDHCLCDEDTKYTGLDCEVPVCNMIPNSDPSVCSGNGTCVAFDHCVCDDDTKYTGSNCEVAVCNLLPSTDAEVCSRNGSCVAFDHCVCDNAAVYAGEWCDLPVCNGEIAGSGAVCSGGRGTCVEPDLCTCTETENWDGTDCEIPLCYGLPAASSACGGSERGTCDVDSHTCTCVDPENWGGLECDVAVCDDDCSDHGTCESPQVCACDTGFSGDTCAIDDGALAEWSSLEKAGLAIGVVVGTVIVLLILIAVIAVVVCLLRKRKPTTPKDVPVAELTESPSVKEEDTKKSDSSVKEEDTKKSDSSSSSDSSDS